MNSLLRGAGLALLSAFIIQAAPAAAEIQLKVGCDGRWVERGDSDSHSYKVCEHKTEAYHGRAALLHRLHARRFAHIKPHKALARVAVVIRQAPPPHDLVVAADAPLRRDVECVILSCPQPIFTGVGF